MNVLTVILIAVFLSACDLVGSGKSGNIEATLNPSPSNLAVNGNLYDYTVSVAISDFPIADIEDLSRIGTTPNAACMVIWEQALIYSAYCVPFPNYPEMCTPSASGIDCPIGAGTLRGMLVDFFGPARTLTEEETQLVDGIVKATICNAPRANGDQSPCV